MVLLCMYVGKRMVPQKLEPKLLFANERTFMKWLHMAVLLSSTSMAILSLAPSRQVDGQMQMVQYLALFLLPVSLFFIVYGMWTYLWRSEIIKRRMVPRCVCVWTEWVTISLLSCIYVCTLLSNYRILSLLDGMILLAR